VSNSAKNQFFVHARKQVLSPIFGFFGRDTFINEALDDSGSYLALIQRITGLDVPVLFEIRLQFIRFPATEAVHFAIMQGFNDFSPIPVDRFGKGSDLVDEITTYSARSFENLPINGLTTTHLPGGDDELIQRCRILFGNRYLVGLN